MWRGGVGRLRDRDGNRIPAHRSDSGCGSDQPVPRPAGRGAGRGHRQLRVGPGRVFHAGCRRRGRQRSGDLGRHLRGLAARQHAQGAPRRARQGLGHGSGSRRRRWIADHDPGQRGGSARARRGTRHHDHPGPGARRGLGAAGRHVAAHRRAADGERQRWVAALRRAGRKLRPAPVHTHRAPCARQGHPDGGRGQRAPSAGARRQSQRRISQESVVPARAAFGAGTAAQRQHRARRRGHPAARLGLASPAHRSARAHRAGTAPARAGAARRPARGELQPVQLVQR